MAKIRRLVLDTLKPHEPNIIDLATGNVRNVVETPGKVGDVEISPDGRRLAMVAGVDVNDPAATTLHWVDTANGSYRAVNAGAAEAVVSGQGSLLGFSEGSR